MGWVVNASPGFINSGNETMLCPAFLVILLVTGSIRGEMETKGKICQIEVTENSLFY